MAAERIGDSSEWMEPVDVSTGPEPILIETDKFSASAINMYDMPSLKVLEIMSVSGQLQMVKMIDLFRLALTNPRKVEEFEVLSFNELTDAVGVWVNKSEPNDSEGEPEPEDYDPDKV